ncbi:uncharacterized protein LOC9634998 [Selaginella moellendorffii]|uniref:uncharacterized protein LOC9634998 n=1 Tax=Selaginella moellendorffii TaxID=88036 RepID=UPI000D1C29D7|nr:uncharacterized protein LOC9634998 [Selaginella moellendorffii]|eukprot:XP_024527375.1 uncharacterized protein LOC9634998 [Selaginella moellendorffii]
MKPFMGRSSSSRRPWIVGFPAWSKKNQPQQRQQQQEQPFLHRAMKRARLVELCFSSSNAAHARGDGEDVKENEMEEVQEEEERAMMVESTDSSSGSSRTAATSSSSFCSSSGSTCGAIATAIAPSASIRSSSVRGEEWGGGGGGAAAFHGVQAVARKRVMVVVDDSREAKTALLWALSHVVHKLDVVTLLHVLYSTPCSSQPFVYDSQDSRAIVSDKTRLRSEEKGCELIASLKNLCALRQPEVDVEMVVVAGERGPTIVRQAKKLDASILVLGQKKLNFFQRCLRWNRDDQSIDYCIQHADCLTLSVRRKSKHCGGYLINSKWQKNFWLLA